MLQGSLTYFVWISAAGRESPPLDLAELQLHGTCCAVVAQRSWSPVQKHELGLLDAWQLA